MRKNALSITLTTLVLGVFGAFLRWLQTRNIFEETGLATPRAPLSTAYLLYSAAALAVIAVIVFLWLRRYAAPTEPAAALRCETAVPLILSWLLCALLLCGGMVLLFSADGARYPMLQRVFAAFSFFGGLSLPFLPARRGALNPMGRTASVVFTFFCCFWLVFSYKTHSEDPTVWAYGPEMVALAATTLGAYELSAYFFSRAKPLTTLLLVQLAAFLDISVIFDSRALGLTAMFAVSAAFLLLLEYLLIANLSETRN